MPVHIVEWSCMMLLGILKAAFSYLKSCQVPYQTVSFKAFHRFEWIVLSCYSNLNHIYYLEKLLILIMNVSPVQKFAALSCWLVNYKWLEVV